ncbi:MAG: hypothetical protein KIS66_05790 [Fimbriimonadaceae bacterium]|nr:hypothetical protein [Fimbriimonadaceae bacterium]
MIDDRLVSWRRRSEEDVFLFAAGELGGWRKACLAVRAVFDPRLRERLEAVASLSARFGDAVRGAPLSREAPYARTVMRAKWALALCLAASAGAFLAYRLASTGEACETYRPQTPPAASTAHDKNGTIKAEPCLGSAEVVSE